MKLLSGLHEGLHAAWNKFPVRCKDTVNSIGPPGSAEGCFGVGVITGQMHLRSWTAAKPQLRSHSNSAASSRIKPCPSLDLGFLIHKMGRGGGREDRLRMNGLRVPSSYESLCGINLRNKTGSCPV